MSRRHESEGRTIHPRALAELGEEACIVALGVARDMRSGAIPPEDYDQGQLHPFFSASPGRCGTPCCIAGHIAMRMNVDAVRVFSKLYSWGNSLFAASHPSDPLLAADAIERYVYDGSETPWEVS